MNYCCIRRYGLVCEVQVIFGRRRRRLLRLFPSLPTSRRLFSSRWLFSLFGILCDKTHLLLEEVAFFIKFIYLSKCLGTIKQVELIMKTQNLIPKIKISSTFNLKPLKDSQNLHIPFGSKLLILCIQLSQITHNLEEACLREGCFPRFAK
ncbi:hypothetical protein FGO68_gene1121 [Halteria grandinella]|uniref:Uncharacterized protein n=1 Tax=Halteria grandinella TaxID=5974 RepID=A0A8J8NA07_HALGN|nr:hypothetical protein FGO68_gene1121 [Halteria grandinella]